MPTASASLLYPALVASLLVAAAGDPPAVSSGTAPAGSLLVAAAGDPSAASSGTAAAAPGSGSAAVVLRGTVLDERLRAIPHAEVRLFNESGAREVMDAAGPPGFEHHAGQFPPLDAPPCDRRVRTDRKGRFAFDSVPGGGYVLVTQARGRPPVATGVVVSEVRGVPAPEIVLPRGHVLRARVADEQGEPVAGARVWVLLPDGSVREGSSATDGSVRIAEVSADAQRGFADAPGFVTAPNFELRWDETARFVLARPQVVAGVVVRSGAPVAGAEVLVAGYSGPPVRTLTDAEGKFRLADADAGKVWISAKLGAARSAFLPLQGSGPGALPITLSLLEPARVEVRIRDTDGAPAPDATVRVDREELVSGAGPDGIAILVQVPAGEAELVVAAPGRHEERYKLQLSPGDTRSVEATLVPGHDLRVRAVRDGAPARDFTYFHVMPASPGARGGGSTQINVGADGVGLARGLGPGRYNVSTGGGCGSRATAEVQVPATSEVVLSLETGCDGEIRGRVLDTRGRPGSRIRVRAATGNPACREVRSEARSDAAGRFTLPTARRCGSYFVQLDLDGELAGGAAVSTDVAPGASDVKLVVPARGDRSLRGLLVDSGGQPVGSATVTAIGRPGTRASTTGSDRLGRFQLDDLPDGPLKLQAVVGRELAGPVVELPPGASTARLEADLGNSVRGTVVGPDGQPLQAFRINGEPRRDPSGRFRLQGVGRAVSLEFGAEGLAATTVRRAIPTGSVTDLGVIRLLPAATLLVKVLDAAGAPARGAFVRAWQKDGRGKDDPWNWGREEGDGEYVVGGLAAGDVRIAAEHRSGSHSAISTLRLVAGKNVATARLLPDGAVNGKVRCGGAPAGRVHVGATVADPDAGSHFSARSEDGTFELKRVPSGRLKLSVLATAALSGRRGPQLECEGESTIEVPAGGIREVTLDLPIRKESP